MKYVVQNNFAVANQVNQHGQELHEESDSVHETIENHRGEIAELNEAIENMIIRRTNLERDAQEHHETAHVVGQETCVLWHNLNRQAPLD